MTCFADFPAIDALAESKWLATYARQLRHEVGNEVNVLTLRRSGVTDTPPLPRCGHSQHSFFLSSRFSPLWTWLLLATFFLAPNGDLRAQEDPSLPEPSSKSTSAESLQSESGRLEQFEQALQSVVDENRRLAEEVRILKENSIFRPAREPDPMDEVLYPLSPMPPISESSATTHFARYHNGFEIVTQDEKKSPFSLRINNQTQFRFNGFERSESEWIDSAGQVTPILNSSDFLIPRGRLIFSGMAFMPEMSYLLNIDYNTVSSNPIGFRAYVLSYRFSRAMTLSVGQNKVPGSREWLGSASVAQEGPDRSMATTFFRPSLSQGVWLTGQVFETLRYHAMLSNGFNTLNVRPSQYTQRFCLSESVWWEPWGDFGRGYPDLQAHQQPVIRIGSSFTFALAQSSELGGGAPENSLLRLSDGTLITQTGALAPGVTVQEYNVSLAAFDVSYKYRGCSLATEIYLQQLSALRGNGPLPMNSISAHGGFVQGGYFVRPQEVELYSRGSVVAGGYGTGTEIGGGVNWFPIKGQNNLRFTFDLAWLENSPAEQNRTGFVAGQSGLLLRTQIVAAF